MSKKQDWSSRWPFGARVTVEFILESDKPMDLEQLRETMEIYIESGAMQDGLNKELERDGFSAKFAGFAHPKVKGHSP